MQNIVIKTLNEQEQMMNVRDALVYCEENNTTYLVGPEGEWSEVSVEGSGLEMNLYDLNKNIMNQMEPLAIEEMISKREVIMEYPDTFNQNYHMLMCREYNYYTVFAHSDIAADNGYGDFAATILEIIHSLGPVYSIERNADGVVEIWIKPEEEETPLLFYLFPYDAGVVYYG